MNRATIDRHCDLVVKIELLDCSTYQEMDALDDYRNKGKESERSSLHAPEHVPLWNHKIKSAAGT